MTASGTRVYHFADCLLNLDEHRLSRRGQEISLRPKSYEVLVHLVERHGHLVTKEELLSAVWPKTYVTERTLQTSISEIREALGDRGDMPGLIKTIPKVGYQFVGEVEEVESGEPRQERIRKPWVITLGAAMILLATLLWWMWDSLYPPIPENASIAVLCFKVFSSNSSDEYLGDALTDEIITKLAKIGISVIAYTSTEYYKDHPKPTQEIAEDLGVDCLLEGSLHAQGTQVEINAQLIDGRTKRHLWVKEYERKPDEVLLSAAEITQDLVSVLQMELSPEKETEIQGLPTDNLEAYSLYQQGCYYQRLETVEGQRKAIEILEQAIEKDSRFALAYAALADASYTLFRAAEIPPEERDAWRERRDEALGKALELDETIPAAHRLSGMIAWLDRPQDLTAAEEALRRALELDPRDAASLVPYGQFLCFSLGRIDEALSCLTRARMLDPISVETIGNLADCYYYRGEFDQTMEWGIRMVEFHPESPWTHLIIGKAYLGLGEYKKAQPWLEKAFELEPEHPSAKRHLIECYRYQGKLEQARSLANQAGARYRIRWLARIAFRGGEYGQAKDLCRQILDRNQKAVWAPVSLGFILWKEGNQTAARELLTDTAQRLEERIATGYQDYSGRLTLTLIHAIQGDREEACDWLQEAIDAGWREYRTIEGDPRWENLREEPRFRQMRAEVKADVDRMRKRVEKMEPELESLLAR